MANEAFALSPISARAAEPNEADYDAIREAFMETARGRWFLTEYAKRNRNADTSMVLDAVARIEEALAAQRQPVVVDRLPEALQAIRRAIREAETVALAAFDPAAIETGLGPVHRGVRIIREISWRWREIGADGRICDLIDSQLSAIEEACGQIGVIDPRIELRSAFELLTEQVERTAAQDEPSLHASSSRPSAPSHETAQDETAAVEAQGERAEPTSAEQHVTFDLTADHNDSQAEAEDDLTFDAAAEAEDEAVLARIAMEMAAPDPDFEDAIAAPVEIAAPIAPEPSAEAADPILVDPAPEQAATVAPVPMAAEVPLEAPPVVAEAAPLPAPSPLAEQPSLGASILASGMLQKPRAAASDPLAPLRRMTQAEKIAFFS